MDSIPRTGCSRASDASFISEGDAEVDGTCHRYSLASCHHHPPRTFSTLGFTNVGTLFLLK